MPRDLILETAVRIVDEKCADALTFRALAERLSSSTATLYRHFASRSELVALVVDRIIGDIRLAEQDVASLPWDAVCRSLATAMFDSLSTHRGVATLLAETVPTGPNGLAVREQLLGVLLRAGFEPIIALRAVATISHYVLGFAMQSFEGSSTGESAADVSVIRELDAGLFPATAAVAHLIPRPLREEFAFGLDLLLRGLADETPDAE